METVNPPKDPELATIACDNCSALLSHHKSLKRHRATPKCQNASLKRSEIARNSLPVGTTKFRARPSSSLLGTTQTIEHETCTLSTETHPPAGDTFWAEAYEFIDRHLSPACHTPTFDQSLAANPQVSPAGPDNELHSETAALKHLPRKLQPHANDFLADGFTLACIFRYGASLDRFFCFFSMANKMANYAKACSRNVPEELTVVLSCGGKIAKLQPAEQNVVLRHSGLLKDCSRTRVYEDILTSFEIVRTLVGHEFNDALVKKVPFRVQRSAAEERAKERFLSKMREKKRSKAKSAILGYQSFLDESAVESLKAGCERPGVYSDFARLYKTKHPKVTESDHGIISDWVEWLEKA